MKKSLLEILNKYAQMGDFKSDATLMVKMNALIDYLKLDDELVKEEKRKEYIEKILKGEIDVPESI